jgi:hypothetical protein
MRFQALVDRVLMLKEKPFGDLQGLCKSVFYDRSCFLVEPLIKVSPSLFICGFGQRFWQMRNSGHLIRERSLDNATSGATGLRYCGG